MVPEGADAVVKIEDTSAVKEEAGSTCKESKVMVAVRVTSGAFVRQIGSDILAGEWRTSCASLLGVSHGNNVTDNFMYCFVHTL
jgi:hypothetical protein